MISLEPPGPKQRSTHPLGHTLSAEYLSNRECGLGLCMAFSQCCLCRWLVLRRSLAWLGFDTSYHLCWEDAKLVAKSMTLYRSINKLKWAHHSHSAPILLCGVVTPTCDIVFGSLATPTVLLSITTWEDGPAQTSVIFGLLCQFLFCPAYSYGVLKDVATTPSHHFAGKHRPCLLYSFLLLLWVLIVYGTIHQLSSHHSECRTL